MAVGVIVPHLKFQENRRQKQENQAWMNPPAVRSPERQYAQGAETGRTYGHGVNNRFPGVNIAVKTSGQRNGRIVMLRTSPRPTKMKMNTSTNPMNPGSLPLGPNR